MTTPSTPTLSIEASASSSSTPATSVDNPKPPSPSNTAPEILTLDNSDGEDAQMTEVKPDQDNGETKGTKRKGKDSNTSAPSSKKTKLASSTSTPANAKASGSGSKKASTSASKAEAAPKDKKKANDEVDDKLVSINFKKNKFDVKQTGQKVEETLSYLKGLTALVDYAVPYLTDDKDALLDDWPEEHHGIIANLVHEVSQTLTILAKSVHKKVCASVSAGMMSVDDESQDSCDIEKRIPISALRTLISTLATRVNYGLSATDLSSAEPKIDLPEGAKDVHVGLQIWSWEVEDLGLLASEWKNRWEKRKAEREEIKTTALALFLALTPEQQFALLSKTANTLPPTSTSTPTSAPKEKKPVVPIKSASAKAKGKGKAKAEQDDEEEEEEQEPEAEDEGEEESKPKVTKTAAKGKGKKKKELTEEEKAEEEEKARKKAADAAEKEAKRKEREAAKEKREAEKAEKERVKKEKEEEEEKKVKAKKKQANMFTSFFKTSPVPDASTPNAAATTPAKTSSATASTSASGAAAATPASTSSSASQPLTASKKGFDSVFFPFQPRRNVVVAKVCRDSEKEGRKVEIAEEGESSPADLLKQFHSSLRRSHVLTLSPYPSPPVTVRSLINAISDASHSAVDASEYERVLKDRKKVAVKFLKHYDDVRPGYIGTWTKTSGVVGFRTPFGKETALLNYDYDSEADWEEEPEDGEDAASNGEEEEEEEDAGEVSEVDSWLAGDDEIEYEAGYDSDDDVVMMDAEGKKIEPDDDDDDVVIVEDEAEKKKREREKKKKAQQAKERLEKKKKQAPLPPVIKGLAWEDEETGESPELVFRGMKTMLLNDAYHGLNPFTFISKPLHSSTSSTSAGANPSASSSSLKGKGKENVPFAYDKAVNPIDRPLPKDGSKLPPAPSASTSTSSSSAAAAPAAGTVPPGTVNTLQPRRKPSKPFPSHLLPRFAAFVHSLSGTPEAESKGSVMNEWMKGVRQDKLEKECTKVASEGMLGEVAEKVKGKYVLKESVKVQYGIATSA